ncbi:hypothetical protein MRX96_018024 [Rhipicephalus microplus]
MSDKTDLFKPSLGEMSDDQKECTSEYSDATDMDDDEGQCEMLNSTDTAAETTIDRLVECVDSFLASEDEESEEDDALEENVVEDRPQERRNVAKGLPRYLRGLMGEANMCFARGRYEDAVKMCLEIVRLAPTSPLPFQTLAMIYEELRRSESIVAVRLDRGLLGWGDEHRALVSCAVLARRIEEPDDCLLLSRCLADVFRSRQNLPSAVRVLLDAATKFPAHITAEDIHTLLEMQLTLKMHSAALLVLHDHCGVQLLPLPEGHKTITAELLEDSLDAFERCLVPAELCIDIKTKLVVCLIHLGGPASRYRSCERNEAGFGTRPSTVSPPDSRQLQDTKDSTPQQQQGSASVLLCQARLLWDSGQREAFIESAMTLVRAHCLSVCSAEEYDAVYSNTYHLSRMKVLRELHEKRGFTPGWLTMESGVSVDELQACFLELYRALQETGRMDDLRQVATEVLVAPMFNKDATSTQELEFLSFLAHYQDPDHVEHSFAIIRAMVLKYPNQARAWNLLGLVANQIPAWRKKGFYLRLLYKHENSLPLGVLVAHNAFLCANYKHALAEYTQLLRHVGKEEPMLLLCSGISLMRMAGQQLTLNQNCPESQKSAGVQKSPRKFYWLATQGMAFLCRYLRARGSDCQEALFNVGRALHELSYPHMAVNMYQRALAAPPAVQEMPEVFDLRREIAFNLSLLYQRGGNNELADWCINHYCVI